MELTPCIFIQSLHIFRLYIVGRILVSLEKSFPWNVYKFKVKFIKFLTLGNFKIDSSNLISAINCPIKWDFVGRIHSREPVHAVGKSDNKYPSTRIVMLNKLVNLVFCYNKLRSKWQENFSHLCTMWHKTQWTFPPFFRIENEKFPFL